LYYRYINPVIIAPEAFDVIETSVSPSQRKNLAEVAKTLYQVLVGKSSHSEIESESRSRAEDGAVLREEAEFTKYLQLAGPTFMKFINEASSVVSSEEFFGMDEFHDSGSSGLKDKFSIYITPDEIVQLHNSLIEHANEITPTPEDPLKILLNEMGPAPPLGSAAKGPGSEVVLYLQNRFGKIDGDNQGPVKKLLKETKRLILLVVRVATGPNLLDILEQVATSQQEAAYSGYIQTLESVKEKMPSNMSLNSPTTPGSPETPGDIFTPGYHPVYKKSDDTM